MKHSAFIFSTGAVLLSNAVSSCMKMNDMDMSPAEKGRIDISGIVYDSESEEGFAGMMVALTVFEKEDITGKYPIRSDTTYTAVDGTFHLITTSINPTGRHILETKDVDGIANGLYKPYKTEMFIYSDTGYDSESNTYILKDIFMPVNRN